MSTIIIITPPPKKVNPQTQSASADPFLSEVKHFEVEDIEGESLRALLRRAADAPHVE